MAIEGILRKYDSIMYSPIWKEYFGQSDYYNYGYWDADTRTQHDASENLVEKLLELLPTRTGTILDVACGKGATTRHLLKYYRPPNVVGINISAKQLESSVINAPGGLFAMMDGAQLAFADSFFDNVICVEAVFHFTTRARFLKEACRVLKPGGSLALSDIAFTKMPRIGSSRVPKQNYIRNLEEYKALYLSAGFTNVEIIEATSKTWDAHRRSTMQWAREKMRSREISLLVFIGALINYVYGPAAIKHYLLVSANR